MITGESRKRTGKATSRATICAANSRRAVGVSSRPVGKASSRNSVSAKYRTWATPAATNAGAQSDDDQLTNHATMP